MVAWVKDDYKCIGCFLCDREADGSCAHCHCPASHERRGLHIPAGKRSRLKIWHTVCPEGVSFSRVEKSLSWTSVSRGQAKSSTSGLYTHVANLRGFPRTEGFLKVHLSLHLFTTRMAVLFLQHTLHPTQTSFILIMFSEILGSSFKEPVVSAREHFSGKWRKNGIADLEGQQGKVCSLPGHIWAWVLTNSEPQVWALHHAQSNL